MKTVFNSINEVCHIFAQRSQNEGRAGNVFFEGDKIYSYGHHYELGRFISGKNGGVAILINDSGYSVSTSKHISYLTNATSHYRQFFVTESMGVNVLSELENLAEKLSRARKPENYINNANHIFKQFCKYQEFIGIVDERAKIIGKVMTVFDGEKYENYLNEKKAAIKKAEQSRKRKEKKQFKDDLKKFFNFEKNYIIDNIKNETYIRLSKDQKRIETTKGVIVNVIDAKNLYRLIKAGKDIKGHKIEHYTVIGLNGVLKIGCHNINVKNMHQVGEKLLQL